METCTCLHCGTKLLLKKEKDADGGIARLAAVQAAMLSTDLLKGQIRELEEQARKVRLSFFDFHTKYLFYGKLSHLNKTLEAYQESIGLARGSLRDAIATCGHLEAMEYRFDTARLAAMDIPGFNTADDLLRLYEFITRPETHDEETSRLAFVLLPVRQIATELKEKKEKLKQALETIA
jgi:hypothetical protein